MGTPKALLRFPLPDGGATTFVEHLVHVFGRSHADPVIVVLGHEPDAIRDAVDLSPARIVVNPDYRKGMLSSIQAAVRALEGERSVDGMLICPVDHPEVTADVVDTLISRFEAARPPVVLPLSSGRRGHPVLFSREVFPALLDAPEAVGARQVVWDYKDDLLEVEVSVPGIRVDIDTPEEYRSFRKRADEL